MSKSRKNNRIDSLIIDSGPLLIALTVNYLYACNIERKNDYIDNIWDNFKKKEINPFQIKEYFQRLPNFYTTPHAIGELIGLARSKLKNKIDLNHFWSISINYLKAKNINENFIKILDLYSDESSMPLIKEIGFIDSELIKLAKEICIPILTIDDRTLKAKADKQGVNVIILDDDIYRCID